MEIQCSECSKKISSKSYAISRHVKIHNLNYGDYIEKNYKLISGSHSNCGFCDRIAKPTYKVDHLSKTYEIEYNSGYLCDNIECKKCISLEILKEEYNPKSFEKIGSKSEYLSKKLKISIEEAKKLKYKKQSKQFKNSLEEFIEKYGEEKGTFKYNERLRLISKNSARNKFPCTLENFQKKYGEEIGKIKYQERCDKISYTSSKDFFIEKYGEEIGEFKWKNKFRYSFKSSKISKVIGNILNNLNIKFDFEYQVGRKFVDYYLPDYDIAIEYFGDYWHLNPKKYNESFYNSQLKSTAIDIWRKDKDRLNIIKKEIKTIIVIWESSLINESILEKTINEFKNKKTIIYL
jgi:G:T-mismatch repair DNA endonuclease (very short patch repair protein)